MNPGQEPRESDVTDDSSPGGAKAPLDQTMIGTGDTASDGGAKRGQPESWIGRDLGKYKVTAVLGMGGMGIVLKAHDTTIERDVAIKVLSADLSNDQTALQRFLAEARAAGKLNHPNIVTIHEIGQDGETHYLVLEMVSGGSAAGHLESQGPYSVAKATRIALEACQGLTAAHARGLVHRDMKPANLLLTDDGAVKIADFGLAKHMQGTSMQVTQAGQVLGTPYFMSPEQCESAAVDHRSDIYALGATYYSLLSGKNPYEDSGSIMQVMFAHCNAAPPDPREIAANVPEACAKIIQRAMCKSPDDRYQSVQEMQKDLEAVLAAMSGAGIALPSQSGTNLPRQVRAVPPASPRRFPFWPLTGTLALLAAGALIGFFFFSHSDKDHHTTPFGSSGTPTPAALVPSADNPIRVGILHSLSGTMSDSESPVVDAALLAIDELNQGGGLLGRLIEPVVVDGRSDPATFAREAERLITNEGVCTVFGCWTSATRRTVVPIFEEHDHLLIYPVQYEGIEESPNVVYTGATPNQQIVPAVKWAFAFQGKRKFFLVGSDYVFPRVANEIIKDNVKELGATVVGEAYAPLGSTEFDGIVEQIVAARPDVILNTINGNSNIAFYNSLRAAGILPDKIPTISFSVGAAELKQLDISSIEGDFAAWNYFQSIESPENERFIKQFKARYGPQRVVTDPMEAAYFGVLLWGKAVEEAGSTDPAQIRRALQNQRMRAPEGDVRIDPATQHTFKTPRIGKILADGQFEVVWTSAKPEPPVPYPPSRTTESWHAFLHDLYARWGNQWAAPTTTK